MSAPCCGISKGAVPDVRAGILNCGQTIIKEEGVRSLWKGLTPFAVHLTLKYALRMGTNAFYQSLLRDQVRGRLWGLGGAARLIDLLGAGRRKWCSVACTLISSYHSYHSGHGTADASALQYISLHHHWAGQRLKVCIALEAARQASRLHGTLAAYIFQSDCY